MIRINKTNKWSITICVNLTRSKPTQKTPFYIISKILNRVNYCFRPCGLSKNHYFSPLV
ncbi:hypothetical protein Hanom_Chr02g00176001 [Helianthus anomalus]